MLSPGDGGYSTIFHTGRFRPKVQPLTLLFTIFHEKATPFVYVLFANGTPFTYLVQNFASLLTAVNALYFKQESIAKKNKINVLGLLGPFTDANDRFPYPFIHFKECNPYPSIYLKPEKGTPFGRSLPVQVIIGSTPRVLSKNGYCTRLCVCSKIKNKLKNGCFYK